MIQRIVHTVDILDIDTRLNRNRYAEVTFTGHDLAETLLRIVKGEE